MKITKQFLLDLYGCDLDEENIERGLKNFDYVVKKCLTPREKKVLDMRYNQNLTLQAIGNALGTSRERVRQIEYEAIKKLQSPRSFSQVFAHDIDLEIEKLRNERIELLDKLQVEVKDLHKFLEWVKAFPDELVDVKNAIVKKSVVLEPIERLELSARSYNALKRQRINTIKDLLELKESDLFYIRNLGVKSANEIINKIRLMGLAFQNEDLLLEDEQEGFEDYE